LEKWVAHCKEVTHHRQGKLKVKPIKTAEKIGPAQASPIKTAMYHDLSNQLACINNNHFRLP
jgi:hypothetical protein